MTKSKSSNVIFDTVYSKTILIEIGDWQVCRWLSENEDITYGEHVKGCSVIPTPNAAEWGWEVDDPMLETKGEVCWICYTSVPPEVVALVKLYNYGG